MLVSQACSPVVAMAGAFMRARSRARIRSRSTPTDFIRRARVSSRNSVKASAMSGGEHSCSHENSRELLTVGQKFDNLLGAHRRGPPPTAQKSKSIILRMINTPHIIQTRPPPTTIFPRFVVKSVMR